MDTTTLKITIQNKDLSIFEPLFKRLNVRTTIIEDEIQNELPKELLEELQKGENEIDKGNYVTHENVMQEAKAILK
jgi:hypothetical protein